MKAVFLDRDGVINEDRDDYVKCPAELNVFPYTPESIRKLNDAGFEVIVISNQQGVAKGLISEDNLRGMQEKISSSVNAAGGRIAEFYYCKHLATDKCDCRKPQPGMLIRAASEQKVTLSETFMVGDADSDVIAGKNAGCKTILVLSGKLSRDEAEHLPHQPDFIADNLAMAVDYIISQSY